MANRHRREFATCLKLFILTCHALVASGVLVNGGQYRIRSMYDGLYVTAGPRGRDAEIGGLTSEKWGNFREQRWDLIGLDQRGKEYWISSHENTFNEMSAAMVKQKMNRHITQLIPVKMNTYMIQSSLTGRCFDNPGYGMPILFLPCDDLSVQQHWELDLLSKH